MKLITTVAVFAVTLGGTLYLRHEGRCLVDKWQAEAKANMQAEIAKSAFSGSHGWNSQIMWQKQQQDLNASIRNVHNMRHTYTPNIQIPQPPRITMPSVPGVRR